MDQQLEIKVKEAVTYAETYEVTDTASFEAGSSWLSVNKGLQKEVKATFKPIIDKQNEALEQTKTQMKIHLAPLEASEAKMKAKLTAWYTAETARINKEREEARLKAEREAQELKLKQAINAEQRGDKAAADKILDRPATPVPTPPVREAPKAKGFSVRQDADYEIVDENAIPREYLMIDNVKIRGVVRALKLQTNIPGVRVFMKDVASQRSA